MPGASEVIVRLTVNGAAAAATVPARTLLVHFLRDELRLTGTHVGCDTTQCGACTVDLDGVAVKSCTILAAQADGHADGTAASPPAPEAALPAHEPPAGNGHLRPATMRPPAQVGAPRPEG